MDSLEELGVNDIGELWFRGPNIMAGYLNNPRATADTVDRDGWLHTGLTLFHKVNLNSYQYP